MRRFPHTLCRAVTTLLLTALLAGCGYNDFQRLVYM